jgi:xylulokinase
MFTSQGNVSGYMCSKYGFPADCKVVAFTGDNMSSLAGLAPRKGDVMVTKFLYPINVVSC